MVKDNVCKVQKINPREIETNQMIFRRLRLFKINTSRYTHEPDSLQPKGLWWVMPWQQYLSYSLKIKRWWKLHLNIRYTSNRMTRKKYISDPHVIKMGQPASGYSNRTRWHWKISNCKTRNCYTQSLQSVKVAQTLFPTKCRIWTYNQGAKLCF